MELGLQTSAICLLISSPSIPFGKTAFEFLLTAFIHLIISTLIYREVQSRQIQLTRPPKF